MCANKAKMVRFCQSRISESHDSKVVIGPDCELQCFRMNRSRPIQIVPESFVMAEVEYETYIDVVHVSFDSSN